MLWLVPAALAEDVLYAPHAADEFPMRVFWGDTHVHSSFSMDANTMGNTRLTPADAYRFAKGEKVRSASGMLARLEAPLDFLVVSDHAEYMGLLPKLRAGDRRLMRNPAAKRLGDGLRNSTDGGLTTIGELIGSLMSNEPLIDDPVMKRDIWQQITRLADQANDPGRFTALIGFEWTSMPRGDNLHRVVVYADGAPKASRLVPVSAFDGERPEDLWAFMEKYEGDAQGRILAIPHNANVSNGRMFAVEDSQGAAFDRAYAERRARLEPVVEVTQIKGDAEAHPLLSPDDEFADFETWDFGNLNPLRPLPKRDDMLRFEYARSALKLGLAQAQETGVNPFKFGMIGSTDAHTSLATAAENDFWGKVTISEPGPRNTGPGFMGDEVAFSTWDFVSSGYAAVWARENTREALFEALQRKEVYATTGSRITVRFFGGWDYAPSDVHRPDAVRIGYRKGVPMGGDLPPEASGAPRFLVTALKDPNGANLDRIQIVKGWHTSDGSLEEKVYDVALSDGRRQWLGRVRPVGSSVDEASASYTNDIGDAMLASYWEDPDFDPAELAFYYARVIEIPTPRWNVYDAVRLGTAVPQEVPTQIQDRAYTSPIWYTP
ncbi:MAG: DUF3604 domain-containing protein [Deltaproteobacteria bacterium]|nr:DUF3604 domain-containing protein [Deltaproteobacteria bacterium]MBW2362362.1 DUF3604 domain-containing protein [Deltaproteobacteria bacterium]